MKEQTIFHIMETMCLNREQATAYLTMLEKVLENVIRSNSTYA